MTEIDLTKYIRLPKFLATEQYIAKLSKFLIPGNYTIGKQEIGIYGCDNVMSTYSDLISAIPDAKVKPLAPNIEIDALNIPGFVFVWLYINGVIGPLIIDNPIKSYTFAGFLRKNYRVDHLITMTDWLSYFNVSTDISNIIVGALLGDTQSMSPSSMMTMLKKSESIYWIDPWKYYNYGELAYELYSHFHGKFDIDNLKLANLKKNILNSSFKFNTDKNKRIGALYAKTLQDRRDNGELLPVDEFAQLIIIKVDLDIE